MAGTWRAAGYQFRKLTRPPTIPQERYTGRVSIALPPAVGTATVTAQGTATVQLGPQGWGTRWVPAMAVINTSTGANDPSTCQVFVGGQAVPPASGGTSYAGGGDSVGLPGVEMQPGDLVIALWAGAKPGDTATLLVYGEQTVAYAP